MGKLYYGSTPDPVVVPDRLLGYLKIVTATKLRRSESFTLTWSGDDTAAGRSTIWLQPSIALRFVFDAVEPEHLAAEYLRVLADQASSSSGLIVDLRTWEDAEASTRPAVRAVRAA